MRAEHACRTLRRFPIAAKLAAAIAFAPLVLSAAEMAPGARTAPALRCPPLFVAKCAAGMRPVCVQRKGQCCIRAQCQRR